MKRTENFDLIMSITNTPKRRHNFFNYSTLFFNTSESTFFLLGMAYRKTGSKGQAKFLNDAYIQEIKQETDIDVFVRGGLNLNSFGKEKAKKFNDRVNSEINSVGKTAIAKIKNHGLFSFVNSKISGDPTAISPEIFDKIIVKVAGNLRNIIADDVPTGDMGNFRLDHDYQPTSKHKLALPKFKEKLDKLGFNTEDLGIY